MSRIAGHVAAAIAAGLGKPGTAQAKPAGSQPSALPAHVAKAITAGRNGTAFPLQAKPVCPVQRLPPTRFTANLPAPAARLPPRNIQCMEQQIRAEVVEANKLKAIATGLFSEVKKKQNSKLMEIQTSIFDGKMFIAANYSSGPDVGPVDKELPNYKKSKGVVSFEEVTQSISTHYHAEQSILLELAKVLRNVNKTNPSRVVVIGSKRPCNNCRRVLTAFNRALRAHYPEVNLHWIDRTGDDTLGTEPALGQPIDLKALDDKSNSVFSNFVDTYDAQLKLLLKEPLSGEDEPKKVRMKEAPDVEAHLT